MSKRAVRSFTAASPRVSDSKIARRLGSASAWKILFSRPRSAWRIYKRRLMDCQVVESAIGLPVDGARMTTRPLMVRRQVEGLGCSPEALEPEALLPVAPKSPRRRSVARAKDGRGPPGSQRGSTRCG